MDICFVSLGCDKNLVDSEMMVTSLRQPGYNIVYNADEADVIIVNTCCFIGDAKEESINTLLEMAAYKEEGKCKLLVAAGCLAQRYHEEIKKELPEVDIIIGTTAYEELAETINSALNRAASEEEIPIEKLKSIDYLPEPYTNREAMNGGGYAYLKIAEGCNKHCTYCVIPQVRGSYRSIPAENLVKQAESLVANGIKEIILVAQETTLYGEDIYGKKSLPELLRKLSGVEGLKWIRILYCYPEEITDEIIKAIKELPKVCHYLDIPVQHGSDSVLKRMGRHTNSAQLAEIIEKLRSSIPDIILRTTIITGFPGETEKEFNELKEFVRRMKFDRLGVFTYSQEEDTPAAEMQGQVPEEIKEARRNEIMEIQQQLAFEKNRPLTGREMDVIVDGYLPEDGVYICRTYMDAPDVDGYVFVKTGWQLMSGDFIKAKITGSDGYDLVGDVVS
ncbi:MAG: 30S ribosomal protein S12 methylthiotransferase RimO [Lachnospiraceae bacterium]|nr:30S ribosomal protein S12 methylthiotransferase RimO [Lachnospiraceae bacterium]